MRFQCRIGTGTVLPPPAPLPTPLGRIEPPARPLAVAGPTRSDKCRHKLARGAIASAALLAAVGCATVEPGSLKAWKVEPVFNVTHSAASSQAYYMLGQYFDGSMMWDKAIDAYRKAIAADAKNIDAYDALGVALAQAGRLTDAEITLRQAVALAPERLRARNNLGYVLLLAGNAGEAVVLLKSVVDQDSSHAIAAANLSQALARLDAAAGGTAIAAQALIVPIEPITPIAPVAPVAPARPATPNVAAAMPAAAPVEPPVAQASRLEVSNGNGVSGMAARVSRWLAARGMATERLSNRQPFAQRHTVVQYRSGHEDAALRVARLLPATAKAEPQATPGLRSDVRVVLGHDWVHSAACLERNTCRLPDATVAMTDER